MTVVTPTERPKSCVIIVYSNLLWCSYVTMTFTFCRLGVFVIRMSIRYLSFSLENIVSETDD